MRAAPARPRRGGRRTATGNMRAPSQSRPSQRIPSRIAVDRRLGRARAVGILDAQQELAAVVAREQPVEQRGAGAADMQEAGRRGREAGDDRAGSDALTRALSKDVPRCRCSARHSCPVDNRLIVSLAQLASLPTQMIPLAMGALWCEAVDLRARRRLRRSRSHVSQAAHDAERRKHSGCSHRTGLAERDSCPVAAGGLGAGIAAWFVLPDARGWTMVLWSRAGAALGAARARAGNAAGAVRSRSSRLAAAARRAR